MREQRIFKFDNKTSIVSYIWKEEGMKVRGCLEIFHGMAENILRFDEMANYFVKEGFIVIGHDHYAHGDSAESIEKIGECTDYDFMDAVIKAMKLVRDEYDEYFKDTKRCLFAHSMGSMAAQRYIQKYPNDFDYVVLSGTDIGGGKYKFGKPLLKLFTKDGKIKYSNFVLNMSTTGFNKKFKKDHPKYGWLSRNPHNIKAFEESPYCGKDFPTNYFYSMAKMMCENVKPENLKRINPKVKIFIYSGKEDPVSNYGKSILKLEKLYKKYGLNVTSKVIPNARHEVHNENEEIKLELFKTIVDFYSK
ncbi:MAG: alpha/beta hydrolase [Bacilli bacterium]|nr:alpha/beta hydrolase [Bacilli bacterium]MDY4051856.1 alpha/beta hydrolase [Bacilli bacterium]